MNWQKIHLNLRWAEQDIMPEHQFIKFRIHFEFYVNSYDLFPFDF